MTIHQITFTHPQRGTYLVYTGSESETKKVIKEEYSRPEIEDAPEEGPPATHHVSRWEIQPRKKDILAMLKYRTPSTDNG